VTTATLEATPKRGPISEIISLASAGLIRMYDPAQKLFVHLVRESNGVLVAEGVSPRYTLMTLLGLHRRESAGGKSPIAIGPVLDGLVSDTSWIPGVGDLGLLLWTVAVISPERFSEVASKLDVHNALDRYKDGRRRSTMELAWFLTGLAYGLRLGQPGTADFLEDARSVYELLKKNQGPGGTFGHLAAAGSLAGALRGRIGSFADQVYPIYAFSQFSKVEGGREPLELALGCAQVICELQGPNGEWWWHYNSANGAVVETYPVYSVHQDGMAPMALFALSEASGKDFSAPLSRGLKWISGANDLKFDMRDTKHSLIWRNFYWPRSTRYVHQIFGSEMTPKSSDPKLRVNHECRPYELGWALYALAGREHLLK
jgi:hypothetical protein